MCMHMYPYCNISKSREYNLICIKLLDFWQPQNIFSILSYKLQTCIWSITQIGLQIPNNFIVIFLQVSWKENHICGRFKGIMHHHSASCKEGLELLK